MNRAHYLHELLAAEAAYARASWSTAPAALNRLRAARDAYAMALIQVRS